MERGVMVRWMVRDGEIELLIIDKNEGMSSKGRDAQEEV